MALLETTAAGIALRGHPPDHGPPALTAFGPRRPSFIPWVLEFARDAIFFPTTDIIDVTVDPGTLEEGGGEMKAKTALIGACMAFLFGCGSDDGMNGGGSAPTIENLQYIPTSAKVGGGGGTIPLIGRLNFSDQDGDVQVLRLANRPCAKGGWVYSNITLEGAFLGETSGEISFADVIATSCPEGDYEARVSVVDSGGRESNVLTAPYTLMP
jgi:hypothetical protein